MRRHPVDTMDDLWARWRMMRKYSRSRQGLTAAAWEYRAVAKLMLRLIRIEKFHLALVASSVGVSQNAPCYSRETGLPAGSLAGYDADEADRYYRWLKTKGWLEH